MMALFEVGVQHVGLKRRRTFLPSTCVRQTQQYRAHLPVPKSSRDPGSSAAKTLLLGLLSDTCNHKVKNKNFYFFALNNFTTPVR